MKPHHALLASATLAATLLSATTAHATLTAVTLGGVAGAGVYDSTANVTWLYNANLYATNTFGVAGGIVTGPNAGQLSWDTAEIWIAAMNAADYLGYNTWELPTSAVPDAGCGSNAQGFGCTGSMMGNLFYTELGGTAGSSITFSHNASYSLFINVEANFYWSGTTYAPDPATAWHFYMGNGSQLPSDKANNFYAWAVLPGDVAAIPEANTYAMFLAGLGLIGAVVRRRR